MSNLFDLKESRLRRDEGIARAVDHANRVDPDWNKRVWELFTEWLGRMPVGFRFMIEDFRLYLDAQKKIAKPPSLRAFGFIPGKAARLGMITKMGTAQVKNVNANCANAGVWIKV